MLYPSLASKFTALLLPQLPQDRAYRSELYHLLLAALIVSPTKGNLSADELCNPSLGKLRQEEGALYSLSVMLGTCFLDLFPLPVLSVCDSATYGVFCF